MYEALSYNSITFYRKLIKKQNKYRRYYRCTNFIIKRNSDKL